VKPKCVVVIVIVDESWGAGAAAAFAAAACSRRGARPIWTTVLVALRHRRRRRKRGGNITGRRESKQKVARTARVAVGRAGASGGIFDGALIGVEKLELSAVYDAPEWI
jgi:hypothetical protein